MKRPNFTWASLATTEPVVIAVDTEFQQSDTLSIQFAVRVADEVRIQVYHSSGLPAPRARWFGPRWAAKYTDVAKRVVVRPAAAITPALSPARVLTDLLGLPPAEVITRSAGLAVPAGDEDDDQALADGGEKGAADVHVQLVGHFLQADFLRSFGREFWASILLPEGHTSTQLAVRETRVIGLAGGGAERFRPPVVQHVRVGDHVYGVRVSTFDTKVAFGGGSLDELAASFLGMAKDAGISPKEKAAMRRLFRDEPKRAYQYAVADALLTLGVAERMADLHERVYRELGFDARDIPRCHATPGLRAANLILRDVVRIEPSATPSIGQTTPPSAPSLRAVKDQFAAGSAEVVGGPGVSRYGVQTAQTHGGLLYSRSATTLFHPAPGRFRDIDLSSCYPSILGEMAVYVGRPVVWEPGNTALTLKEVVDRLGREAAGWDAWFVKVTGDISLAPNALVPSSEDAVTFKNFKSRAARRRARVGNARPGRAADGYSTLYTDEVSAGVVVWATWMIIQALPPAVRAEYENLRVESVVFYPRRFVADSWAALDSLRERMRTPASLDWSQQLDLTARTLVTTDDLDEKYAAVRYPIGRLSGRAAAEVRLLHPVRGADRLVEVPRRRPSLPPLPPHARPPALCHR